MKRQLFFHVGCTYSKESVLSSLGMDGYRVIVLDEVGKKSKNLNLEYHCVYSRSLFEIVSLVEQIAASNALDIRDCAFFTLADGSVELLNRLLDHFGKDPITFRSRGLRNKLSVRRRLMETQFEKLPVVALATNPSDIPIFDKTSFPLIVKPVESMESRNVFRVHCQDELRRACLEIFCKNKTYVTVDHGEIVLEDLYGQSPYALIETALSGDKMSAEVLVHKGRRYFHCVISKYDHANDFFYERADILDPSITLKLNNNGLIKFLDRLIADLEICSAILHVEFFFNSSDMGFHLIEVNFRLGGGHIHDIVQKSYGRNIVAEFLDLVSGIEAFDSSINVKQEDATKIWAAFDFLSPVGGEFTPLRAEALGSKIEWAFGKGDIVSKFTTSKFFKLGTVVFSADSDEQMNQYCLHLKDCSDQYFSLSNDNYKRRDVQGLGTIKESGGEAHALLKQSIIGIYFAVFLIACSYFYKTFVVQSEIMSDTLAKTLAYHLSNGEIYYVSNIVHNFENGKIFDRIVVTDQSRQVIYASSSQQASYPFYQSTVHPADYERELAIVADGIKIGFLYYDVDYRVLLLRLLTVLVLISLVASSFYYMVVRYLFGRVAVSASREADRLITVIDDIKRDFENMQTNSSDVSFDKYPRLLERNRGRYEVLGDLRRSLLKLISVFRELRDVIVEKRRMADLLDESTKQLVDATTKAAIGNMAAQVSHDIRSPLSALNMVATSLQDIPEDKRLLIRNSVQRINDIANGLLRQSKDSRLRSTDVLEPTFEPVMLVGLLDCIVSEKRLQYRNRMEIEIQSDLIGGYGLFAMINAPEFARVISNLINNSVEALDSSGRITVGIKKDDRSIVVTVTDNGRGIPVRIIDRLGEKGFSFGKVGTQSGFGLGIYHARETIEKFGGNFRIESEVGIGTRVTIVLPRAQTPQWFLERIRIAPEMTVVSADDDQTIHQIWSGRLASAAEEKHNIKHVTFSSLEQFEKWLTETKLDTVIYFIDFEFLNQSGNGLDVIERMGISEKAILVTSRFDEKHVKDRAESMGIKILPKGLAPFLPIEIEESREKYHAVLIDDDVDLVHATWKMRAEEAGKKILCFSNPDEFFARASEIDPASPLYIDVCLGGGLRGEEVAERAGRLSFREIYLATGFLAESLDKPTCVREIVGKEPIF